MKKIFLLGSISLFVVSLTQPAYCTERSCGGSSIAILITGVFGFFMSWAASTWLANPLLIMSWITYKRRPKLSAVSSILATLLAFSFLFFKKIIDDESGDYNVIVSYQPGYWLWVASSLVMLVCNIITYCKAKAISPLSEVSRLRID